MMDAVVASLRELISIVLYGEPDYAAWCASNGYVYLSVYMAVVFALVAVCGLGSS